LPEVRFFEGLSTQCYVAHNDNFAIVAFRGSEIWKKRDKFDLDAVTADMRTNVDIRAVPWAQGGKVHRGFAEALDEVWADLQAHLEELEEEGCRIWITGHSLGAALATLCASRLDRARGVYTFGSPRVGNGDFEQHLTVDIYRVVNDKDIVPRLSYPGDYVHVGTLKFIDQEGRIRGSSNESVAVDADLSRDNNGGSLIPAAFRDHVPLLYTIHLWNNMVRQNAK
jgi:predicted lipase